MDTTLIRLRGNEDILIKYLQEFPSNENYVNMCNAAEKGDWHETEEQAHQLKGMALNLGLVPLADECTSMRMDILDGDMDEAAKGLEKVKQEYKFWCGVING